MNGVRPRQSAAPHARTSFQRRIVCHRRASTATPTAGRHQESRRMVRVAESDQERDENEQPIGLGAVGVIAPEHGEPRDHREEQQ